MSNMGNRASIDKGQVTKGKGKVTKGAANVVYPKVHSNGNTIANK